MDASRIKFRITGLTGGTLQKRASDSDPWSDVDLTLSTQYREFSLADLRGGLVSLKALLGASSLSFDIQAVDDGPHLSDSDPNTLGAQPSSVSILAVPPKTFAAGELVRINDDKALTPDDNTLGAWLTADDTLKIFVRLQGGKSGVFTPSAGVVRERLSLGSHSVPNSKIAVSWHWGDDGDWRLVLEGKSTAAVADFQAVLDVLQMQTVHFAQASTRTILVQPDTSDMSVPVARTGYYVWEVDVSASLPNPILEVDFKKVRVDADQRFVLGEEHIMVYDPDTQDVNDDTDADKIKFRITQIQGGKLQRQSSSSVGDWDDIDLTPATQYREFTLAELRAGKIALQGGDGLQGSDGSRITFEIQAADDGDGTAGSAPNLSDSDSTTNTPDPVGVEIVVVAPVGTTAGYRVSLNADGVLSPNAATFGMWLENAGTYSGTLQVVVKLFGKLSGDVLSLRTGYDTNKITSGWNQATGELSLTLTPGTTVSDIRTALALLEFESALSGSESTRKVWIFPTLSGVSNFRYRADEAAGLVRYYLYEENPLSVWGAATAASGRVVFGKKGYLGVHASNAESNIYKSLWKRTTHLAISDSVTEGKWLVTYGPRKGLLFWDHPRSKYGPGAEGSGWRSHGNFWHATGGSNAGNVDYAYMDRLSWRVFVRDGTAYSKASISHHDLRLDEGRFLCVRWRLQSRLPTLSWKSISASLKQLRSVL